MFKRRKFTLIELIVVIAVLGILAAIVIPNISNFQNKARDAQLTADTRNIQTALDMYRLDQPDGITEPILEEDDEKVVLTVTTADGDEKSYHVIDLEKLYPNYLRQIPKYAVTDSTAINKDDLAFEDGGKVVFAVLLDSEVDGKSTSIVNALSYVNGELTIVR